jgi:hypothetical protein
MGPGPFHRRAIPKPFLREGRGYLGNGNTRGRRTGMTLLWIIIIVLAIIGLMALLGRGRWGARRF